MTKKAQPQAATLRVVRRPNESDEAAFARSAIDPELRHGIIASSFTVPTFSGDIVNSVGDQVEHVTALLDKAAAGDMAMVSRTLAAQAITLDVMFTELARRTGLNMGEHLHAAERYARLAFKAQSNSRATLEALAKLHQPREQTVRHVHVNQGGQAIVAEQFHHHTGGAQNDRTTEQSHATGDPSASPALPCTDTIGDIMPSPGGIRPAAMSDARRD